MAEPGARTLLIACGALAREIQALLRINGWSHLRLQCLPANLHNRPERIPEAVRKEIRRARAHYDAIFVAYADCGTGGMLDRVLAEEGVERIAGAHCYEFFAGSRLFGELADAEPGTFYLTDFIVRHFDRLILRELGIEAHPELASVYFGNYRRVLYLSQLEDLDLLIRAREAADRLGLAFEHRHVGYGELAGTLQRVASVKLERAWQG